jgi:hypothetical protein
MNSQQQKQEKPGVVRVITPEVVELGEWLSNVAGQRGAGSALRCAATEVHHAASRALDAHEVAKERAEARRDSIRAWLVTECYAGIDVIAAQGGSLLPIVHVLVAVTSGVADVAIFQRVATSILEAAGIPPWAVLEEPPADDEMAPPTNLEDAHEPGSDTRKAEGSTTGEPPQSVVRPAGNVNNPAEGVGR